MNKSGGLNLFPKLTEIPENAGLFEPIRGRLLVGGELIQRGFETRPVTSPILLRSEKDTLEDVLLGETPQATSDLVPWPTRPLR